MNLLLPAYLHLSNPPTEDVRTGNKVNGYLCKDPFKALKYELSVLCYDETFYVSNGLFNDTSSFPEESEICVDPTPCPLTKIRNKWKSQVTDKGSYLTVDTDLTKDNIEHGDKMRVTCAQGVEKFVAAIDPQGDGFVEYKCQTGNIVDKSGESSWEFPGVFQCQPVCTDQSITIPAASNFSDPNPNPIRVFDGEKLTLTCKDPSHLLDSDWSDKFEVKCNGDGKFETVTNWPTCVEPPNCGLPPTPNNMSGLVALNEDVEILVPNKAIFYCNETKNHTENNQTTVIQYVTKLGSKIEIACENNTWDGDGFYNFSLPGKRCLKRLVKNNLKIHT